MTNEKQKQVEREEQSKNPEEIKLRWTMEDYTTVMDGKYCDVRGIVMDEQSRKGMLYIMTLPRPSFEQYFSYAIFGGRNSSNLVESLRSEILKKQSRVITPRESYVVVDRGLFEGIFKTIPNGVACRELIDKCLEIYSFQKGMEFKRTFPHDTL